MHSAMQGAVPAVCVLPCVERTYRAQPLGAAVAPAQPFAALLVQGNERAVPLACDVVREDLGLVALAAVPDLAEVVQCAQWKRAVPG